MDPDFAGHIDGLEHAINELDPGSVYEITRGGTPVAVLAHPALYRDLTDTIRDHGAHQ